MANGLSLVKPFDDWQKPISEGYFSKLKSVSSSSGVYPGRQSGAILRDVSLPNYEFKIKDLERVRDRILESIHLGAVTNSDGERLTLTESDGINILGNIVESNTLSVNQILYGDLHNDGHTAIAVCHDPDNRHLVSLLLILQCECRYCNLFLFISGRYGCNGRQRARCQGSNFLQMARVH